MASIYARGNKLWIRVKEGGKWESKRTKFEVGQEEEAMRYAVAAQAIIDKREAANKAPGARPIEPLTVRRWVTEWLPLREQAGIDWKKDRGIMDNHVLPVIGDKLLADVRPVHIAELMHAVRFVTRCAPRTVHNIYSSLSAMFRDAAIRDKITVSPCILKSPQLGPILDADPEWRAQAVFTRDEAERMISDTRIPFDRRMVYGCGLLAGLRPGEIGALRVRHYDPTREPLGGLKVALAYSSKRDLLKGTKTGSSKTIPVHPTLAAMLAEWLLSGWAAMMGRRPEPDDLLFPLPPADAARRTSRTGEPLRGDVYSRKRWVEMDEPMLGWRHRELYATKATFITLALDDGADRDIIQDRVTHTKPRRNAFDGYDRGIYWIQTCTEVSKLKLARRPLATGPATVSQIFNDSEVLTGSGCSILPAIRRTRFPDQSPEFLTTAHRGSLASAFTSGEVAFTSGEPEKIDRDGVHQRGWTC